MKWFTILCCCFVVISGCQRRQETGTVVARVGDVVLLLEDVRAAIDTSRIAFDRQLPRFVSSWVNRELLYQEAKRRGIGSAASFQRRRDEMEHNLLVEDLLQQQVYSDTSGVTNDQLRNYYDQHRAEFVVREDVMKLNLAVFGSREEASAFAAALARGSSWAAAAAKVRKDTITSSAGVSMKLDRTYTQQTIFPVELWKVAATLKTNEVSYPIRTDMGYYIVQPLVIVRKGEPAEYEICRQEVHQRVLIEQRRQHYDEFIGTLRQRYTVEVLTTSGQTTDTTEVHYDD